MLSLSLTYTALVVCAIGFVFEKLIRNVEAITIRSQLNHVSGIGGTTSLHWLSKNSSLLIGTKKGGIVYHSIDDSTNILAEKQPKSADGLGRWDEIESNEYKTKYPIYSMEAMLPNSVIDPSSYIDYVVLFCGSGDRWISVWKLGKKNDVSDFEFVQKLGPHTGWVKDLVYDDNNQILHSIGCNCIETWDCSSLVQTSDPVISHKRKRAIENSPTMGTTLSSDLLCLCLLPPKGDESLLVTGGVDGRIHLWLSNPSAATNFDGNSPLHTISAHEGRVNKIVYSSSTKTIFTVGNDGTLCAFRLSEDGFKLVSRLQLGEESSEESLRITVVSIMDEFEEEGACSLGLGCSNGKLYFVTANDIAKGDNISLVADENIMIAENSMIYSIACEKGPNTASRLWIGHASGLAMVDI